MQEGAGGVGGVLEEEMSYAEAAYWNNRHHAYYPSASLLDVLGHAPAPPSMTAADIGLEGPCWVVAAPSSRVLGHTPIKAKRRKKRLRK